MEYLNLRLKAIYRLVSKLGTVVIHCDQSAVYGLKAVCDNIFGSDMFRNHIIWSYRTGGVSTNYLPKKHDDLLVYSKSKSYTFNPIKHKVYIPNAKPCINGSYGQGKTDFFEDENGVFRLAYITDVWDIPYVHSMSHENTRYSTQKPIALLNRFMSIYTNELDMVLDPFCGSGTTLVAANNFSCYYCGIDQNPRAIEIAKGRLPE